MKVKLHKTQYEVATNNHRFRIVCAGRRWGKSVLAQLIVLQWAIRNPGLYWIISPTYRQSKQIHWRQLQEIIPRQIVAKKNEVELSITLTNGSIIELKGAENPDNLRGVKLKGLVIDEIASIRNWDWVWQEVLRPTLTDYEAPALFISTPKGYNHFYDLFLLGQDEDTGYKSWRFTSYDNPYVSNDEIDQAKKELTEDTFAQEYLADFRTAVGLAHKPWDRTIHVIKPFIIPENWTYGRGFDYGSAHPTASVRVAVDTDDNWFVERTYKKSGRSIKDHAETILSQDYTLGFVPSWGDPSGAQWFTEFAQYNVNIQPANREKGQETKSWVEHCVEKINQKLNVQSGHVVRLPDNRVYEHTTKLFVLDTPENQDFIKEIENLKWREKQSTQEIVSQLDESDDPTGGHYDLMAAFRYFAVSYTPQRKETIQSVRSYNVQKRKSWGIS